MIEEEGSRILGRLGDKKRELEMWVVRNGLIEFWILWAWVQRVKAIFIAVLGGIFGRVWMKLGKENGGRVYKFGMGVMVGGLC